MDADHAEYDMENDGCDNFLAGPKSGTANTAKTAKKSEGRPHIARRSGLRPASWRALRRKARAETMSQKFRVEFRNLVNGVDVPEFPERFIHTCYGFSQQKIRGRSTWRKAHANKPHHLDKMSEEQKSAFKTMLDAKFRQINPR